MVKEFEVTVALKDKVQSLRVGASSQDDVAKYVEAFGGTGFISILPAKDGDSQGLAEGEVRQIGGADHVKVEVFSFWRYDPVTDTSSISPSKRTREAIKDLGFNPIEETKEVVNESDLDDQGRYHTKA